MAIKFQCVCGRHLKTPDDTVGKKAKCPKCDRWLRVPNSETYDTSAEETSPPSKKDKSHPAAEPGISKASGKSPSAQAADAVAPPNKGRVVIADQNEADLGQLRKMVRGC